LRRGSTAGSTLSRGLRAAILIDGPGRRRRIRDDGPVEDSVVARNPDGDSGLPFLIRLPLGANGVVLKVRDTWPRTAKVYCHPSGSPSGCDGPFDPLCNPTSLDTTWDGTDYTVAW
jgi:hypothetical protein